MTTGNISPAQDDKSSVNSVKGKWGLYIIAGISVLVAMASIRYLFLSLEEAAPGLVVHAEARSLSFYLHVGAATFALLFGPWQFFAIIRNKYPLAHKTMGIIYVLSCLVGGLSGIHIAIYSPNGPIAALGFITLGTLWIATTGIGFMNILKGNIISHKRWMKRSFALTFAAVTLRIYVLPMQAIGLDDVLAFSILAWICWIPNLLYIEFYQRRTPKSPALKSARPHLLHRLV